MSKRRQKEREQAGILARKQAAAVQRAQWMARFDWLRAREKIAARAVAITSTDTGWRVATIEGRRTLGVGRTMPAAIDAAMRNPSA